MNEQGDNFHTIISLPERFHGEQAEKIRIAMVKILSNSPGGIVFDFSEVTFIDSTGITVLISVYKMAKAKSIQVILRRMNENVRAFFELTCLDRIFTLE